MLVLAVSIKTPKEWYLAKKSNVYFFITRLISLMTDLNYEQCWRLEACLLSAADKTR